MTDIKKSLKDWEEGPLKKALEKKAEREEAFTTISNHPIRRLYTPVDSENFDHDRDLGYPGQFPYTRGVHETMYRGRLWTMRLFAGFGTAKDSNKRYQYLLEHGQTGLSVAFHMPTIMGYDSDHARSRGEVGKTGVSIDTLEDMETLFHGIPLDRVTTSMTINAPATILLSMYLVVAEKQGVPWTKGWGYDPKRYFEGIHCSKVLDLSSKTIHASDYRHDPILYKRSSTLEHDFDIGIPYS